MPLCVTMLVYVVLEVVVVGTVTTFVFVLVCVPVIMLENEVVEMVVEMVLV